MPVDVGSQYIQIEYSQARPGDQVLLNGSWYTINLHAPSKWGEKDNYYIKNDKGGDLYLYHIADFTELPARRKKTPYTQKLSVTHPHIIRNSNTEIFIQITVPIDLLGKQIKIEEIL